MKDIGTFAEYLVLLKFLENDIEAYKALKANQESYDITVILNNSRVKRVQVKGITLNDSGSTNGSIYLNRKYDFLIIVISDNANNRLFVLTNDDAYREKGSKTTLNLKRRLKNTQGYEIIPNLIPYENRFDKIFFPMTTLQRFNNNQWV